MTSCGCVCVGVLWCVVLWVSVCVHRSISPSRRSRSANCMHMVRTLSEESASMARSKMSRVCVTPKNSAYGEHRKARGAVLAAKAVGTQGTKAVGHKTKAVS